MRTSTLRALSASLLAGAALSGCAALDDEYRQAIPTSQQVTIAVPQAGGGAGKSSVGGVGELGQALVGSPSEYYLFTWTVSTAVNTSALALLALLHGIVEQHPTSQTANSRTWGPHPPGGLDPLTYRAVVTREAPGQYAFSIDARLRTSNDEADFQPLLDGGITLGSSPQTGKGHMTLHFDHARLLKPLACEQGTVSHVFDNTQPVATLDVAFDKFANANPRGIGCLGETPHDATYHYDRSGDGSGNFTFALATNVHKLGENKPALEDVSIRSRWLASGAGRADVKIAGGEVKTDLEALKLGQTSVIVSQCWDTGFVTAYETSTPEAIQLVKTAGDDKACAFPVMQLP